MAGVNGQLIPYNGSYQPAVPIVGQPTGVVQPGSLLPSYVGTATAGDFFYTSPTYSPYPGGLDYGYYPGPRGYRSSRYGKRRRYPRMMGMMDPRMDPRMMDPRMMDPLYDIERMRALDVAEMSYGGYGYGGLGYPRGAMDDGYYSYGGYGSRGMGLCGYPHRRGMMCPDCDYDPYF